MKRLPAQIGITFFTVLAVAFYLPDIAVVIVGALALLASVLLCVIKRTRKTVWVPAIAITVLLSVLLYLGYTAFSVLPKVARYADQTHHVQAVLKDEPYKSYKRYYYRLSTEKLDGENVRLDLLLKTSNPLDAEPDDKLSFTAELTEIDNNYYRAKGYFLMSDSYEVYVDVTEAEHHSLYYYAIQLRKALRRAIEAMVPEQEASLTRAVLVGDKYAMDLETRNAFRYAGASYFIVVSGMHFAVICMVLMRILKSRAIKKFLRINRWIRLALMLILIFVYMAVTGFQSSVMRSGIMMVIYVIGDTVRRQTYPLNHLGIAGILIPILTSPYSAGDYGLILSFYATMSILLWGEPIAHKLCKTDEFGNIPLFAPLSGIKRLIHSVMSRLSKSGAKTTNKPWKPNAKMIKIKAWNTVFSILSVSIAANLLVFPISIFLFREVSLITLVSALILYPAVYLILIFSLFVCVFFYIPFLKWLAAALSWPLFFAARYILAVVKALASLPFAFVRVHSTYVYVWLIITAVLMLVVVLRRDYYTLLPTAGLICAAVLIIGFLVQSIVDSNTLRLEVLECSDGMSVALNSRGNLHLLCMDCKSKDYYRIMRELSNRYGAAHSAMCLKESEYARYLSYSDGEFAISEMMLYDNKSEIDDPNVILFDADSDFILDDGVILSVSTEGKRPTMMLKAGEKRILILPKKSERSDIPTEWIDMDLTVCYEIPEDIEQLQSKEVFDSRSGGYTFDLR